MRRRCRCSARGISACAFRRRTGRMGSNRTMYHDEIVSAEIGQVGTQFDGLGHIGVGDLFYNGNDRARVLEGRRAHEARRRERRRARDARRARRRRGVQGRRAARGRLRDHARRLARRARAAAHGSSRRRRRARAHGLGLAVGHRQRGVRRERARRRPRGRAVLGRARGRARRLGHVGDGGRAESESRAAVPRAPAADPAQRDLHLRESADRGARARPRLRVRVLLRAAEAQRRDAARRAIRSRFAERRALRSRPAPCDRGTPSASG